MYKRKKDVSHSQKKDQPTIHPPTTCKRESKPMIEAAYRLRAIRVLADELASASKCPETDSQTAWMRAREAEASIHSSSYSASVYASQTRRAACNVHINGDNCTADLVLTPNEVLLRGTLIQRIRDTQEASKQRFEDMLRAKHDAVKKTSAADEGGGASSSSSGSLMCRRCGSMDVTWDVKQTRGSDEACTAFCVCSTCSNRWTIK